MKRRREKDVGKRREVVVERESMTASFYSTPSFFVFHIWPEQARHICSDLVLEDWVFLQKNDKFEVMYLKDKDIQLVRTYFADKPVLKAYITPVTKLLFSDIEWKQIIGMRHILIHEYFGVDANLVWQVIVNDIPALKASIENVYSGLK